MLKTMKKFETRTNNKIFRIRNKKQYPLIVNAASLYYSFICALPELSISKPVEIKPEATQLINANTQPMGGAISYPASQPARDKLPVSHEQPEKDLSQDDSASGTLQGGDFDAEFYNWLFSIEGMAVPTCRSYVSALHTAEIYAKEHGFEKSNFV